MELYEDLYKTRFSFGKNWEKFLATLDDRKITLAKDYLGSFLGGEEKIQGRSVVDFGSGSGLMSLCFVLLGAKKVTSIDIDDHSIACANFLREKFDIPPGVWEIKKGSILDHTLISSIGVFDIVYSWGVIHHSGNMWQGLKHISNLVNSGGQLYLAIYNDNRHVFEGTSGFWIKTKRLYATNSFLRPLFTVIYTSYLVLGLILHGKNPIIYIRGYAKSGFRGMDFFRDIEDWLGGYPYEYASFDEIREYYIAQGYKLVNSTKVRSIGCNEFLFEKSHG